MDACGAGRAHGRRCVPAHEDDGQARRIPLGHEATRRRRAVHRALLRPFLY